MKRLVSGQYNNFEKVLSIYDELSPENTQILYNKYRDLFSDKFDNNEDLCALIEKFKLHTLLTAKQLNFIGFAEFI